jgi:hypothetical protein
MNDIHKLMPAPRLKRFINFILDLFFWHLFALVLFFVLMVSGLFIKIDFEGWGDALIIYWGK